MTPDDGVLGRCPNCATKITRAWLLIEYENTEGQTGIWAECPNCSDVVDPDLIVVFGKQTLEAVVDLLSVIDNETADDIPPQETYVLDRYPVLWFEDHIEMEPTEESDREILSDVLEREDW
jgi:hypothetical protein